MKYEINKNTLAVMPGEDDESKIIESDTEYIVDEPTFEVIEHSCEYFGSSYDGRHIGTRKLIGVTHKAPIIIEESNNIIFFPTTSPRLKSCSWLSLNNILSYKQGDNPKTTKVLFKSGQEIIVDCSVGSLNNQILRASRLESVLNSRNRENN